MGTKIAVWCLTILVVALTLWHWWAGLLAVGVALLVGLCRAGDSRAEERWAQARYSCDGDDAHDAEELSG